MTTNHLHRPALARVRPLVAGATAAIVAATIAASAAGATGPVASAARTSSLTGGPVPTAFNPSAVKLSLTRVTSGLRSPLFVTNARDGSRRLFVLEQEGKIRIVKRTTVLTTPFLDITAKVTSGGERGLLGLAFHPQFATNGRFYVDYTDVNGNTVISEFRRSSTNPDRASSTERRLLRITQPYANHNGGMLAFGPDGYLYVAMGDGGSSGDPGNRAQSLGTLLGKLLRIDVDHRTGTLQYAIPSTNPFVTRTGAKREIWSYGLRNPWRFSFDRLTGDLWIGDVGQNRYEEIDRAPRSAGGGRGTNWGWRVLEGRACFNPQTDCNRTGKVAPLAVYTHTLGCSVTGGHVYRGPSFPLLAGGYFFGDYCSGRIWAVTATGSSAQTPRLMLDTDKAISSFGEDEAGNLYLVDHAAGELFRLVGRAP